MSLLLEALQKSARQRQLGTPIKLDEGISRPLPGRRAPRWNLLLLGIAAVAIFIAVRGGFDGADEAPPTPIEESDTGTAPVAGRREVQSAPAGITTTAPHRTEAARSAAARPDAISNEAASGGRSRDLSPPYDEYTRPPPRTAAAPAGKPAAPGKPVDPANLDYLAAERMNQPAGRPAEPPPTDEAVSRPLPEMPPLPGAEPANGSAAEGIAGSTVEPASGPETGPLTQADIATGSEPGTDETGAEPATGRPPEVPVAGPLDYNDLPPAIRRELPPLQITISVYDDDPEQRFVLIDRQRYRLGDDLAPGLRLADIRRDGLILEFRDYRFLWQRR